MNEANSTASRSTNRPVVETEDTFMPTAVQQGGKAKAGKKQAKEHHLNKKAHHASQDTTGKAPQRLDVDDHKERVSDTNVSDPEDTNHEVTKSSSLHKASKERTVIQHVDSQEHMEYTKESASDEDDSVDSFPNKRTGLRKMVQRAANKTSGGVKLVARKMGSTVSNKGHVSKQTNSSHHSTAADDTTMDTNGTSSSMKRPETIIIQSTNPNGGEKEESRWENQNNSSPSPEKKGKIRTIAGQAGKATHAVENSVKTVAGCVKSAVLHPLCLNDTISDQVDVGDEDKKSRLPRSGDTLRDEAISQSKEPGCLLTQNNERKATAGNKLITEAQVFAREPMVQLALLLATGTVNLVYHWKEFQQDQIPCWACLVFVTVAFLIGQIFPFVQGTALPVHGRVGTSNVVEKPTVLTAESRVASSTDTDVSADPSESKKKRKPFSSLNAKNLLKWQKAAPGFAGDRKNSLMRRLVRNKSLRRRRRRCIEEAGSPAVVQRASSAPLAEKTERPATASRISTMGEYGGNSVDNSLVNYVVEPLCQMRGFDIFLTEDCQADVGTHPWLIQQGLRDVPTFCGNIMTQWGNVLMYYAMPEWVKDFDDIVESESDTQEMKAFKRFLLGNDEYRNNRFRVIPSLADGPLPMKILAPAKRERLIHGDSVTLKWVKHNRTIAEDGRVLEPFLECQVDCLSDPSLRGTSSMVKKYLPKLVLDGAACIGPPVGASVAEPEVCVGMWRWERIDLATCPPFPSRYEAENVDPDVLRASRLVRMSTEEVRQILACNGA